MLQPKQPIEIRHAAFGFFKQLVKGQSERLGLLRAHFFRVVKEYNHPEDITERFELFQTLTDNGKDILYFEEEVNVVNPVVTKNYKYVFEGWTVPTQLASRHC